VGSKTSISWTDSTWSPVRGCTRVSSGCTSCYAERLAARFSDPGLWGHGFARRTPDGGRWTGKVELVESQLEIPLHWRKPRRVFVDSLSDTFHEALSFDDVGRIFAAMAMCPQHCFQVLTKRPTRMLEYMEFLVAGKRALAAKATTILNSIVGGLLVQGSISDPSGKPPYRPPANIWLGVSVEDQETADERIPLLLATPAAKRFVSFEPGLGPIDFKLESEASKKDRRTDAYQKFAVQARAKPPSMVVPDAYLPTLDLIIVGGESGPGARPFDVEWARSTIRQCKAAGVACFVKQAGANVRTSGMSGPGEHWPDGTIRVDSGEGDFRIELVDKKGGNMEEWPPDLRVREMPT